MTARIPQPIPVPIFPGLDNHTRIINQNFRGLADLLARAIGAGDLVTSGSITLDMLAAGVTDLVGDVTGTIGDTGSTAVEKIRGKAIAAPAAGDDGKAITYNHAGGALAWTTLYSNPLTTRGDLLTRDASTQVRLPVGSANKVLKTDGTDPSWATITSLLDSLFSSTQGAVLFRGSAAWEALAIGTSGYFLKSNGAGADPSWAAGGGGGVSSPLTTKGDLWGFNTVDDRIPVGANGEVLTADSTDPLGVSWQAAGGAGTNALLDGSVHSDTAAQSVTRGSLIYGSSTPKWDELVLGSAGKVLKSDGTDVAWKWDRCLRADKPTFACSYGGGSGFIVNNGSGTRTAAGGTEADAADTERPSEKFTQSVNSGTSGFGSWPKKVSGAMSPALWADFKIVTASKMNLQIGFNDGGFSASSDTTNTVMLEWQEGTDTNFRFKHNDGAGGVTNDDTGIAKDANWHDVLIYSPDAGTTWILEIDGVQTNSVTTEIPASSTLLYPIAGYGCNGSGSTGNELRESYVVCQTNKAVGS